MKRRLLALILGLIGTVVLLELGIRVAYSTFVNAQTRANLADIAQGDDVVRIACVGESTTAVAGDPGGRRLVTDTSYPTQLERLLNERAPERRFEVLNLGSMSGTTSVTLERLEDVVSEHPPHFVVAMMGIKDTPMETLPGLAAWPDWVASLRSAQLLAWLVEDVRLRREQVEPEIQGAEGIPDTMRGMGNELRSYVRESRVLEVSEDDFEAVLDGYRVGLYLWYVGRPAGAEARLRAMIERWDLGYSALARVLVSTGRTAEAEMILAQAAALHPEEASYLATQAEILTEEGRPDEAVHLLEDGLQRLDDYQRPELAQAQLQLALGDALRAQGEHERAEPVLLSVTAPEREARERLVSWPADYLRDIALGRLYLETGELELAEEHLVAAVRHSPKRHVTMFMLSQVYARTGEIEEEEALRREILGDVERLAEYFELAKMYRRAGHPNRAPELVAEAVDRIPSLERNYRQLYAMAQRRGIRLVVMQYPGFSVDLAQQYAPPAPGVRFIDNEHLFDADPDRYWFSPRFPNSFSHYTEEGAGLVAERVAQVVLDELAQPREESP